MDILVVCEGNVCRSPFVERVLRSRTGWAVGSAGLGALEGHPIEERVARRLHEQGIDPGGFAARQLTPGLMEGVRLVLTATRDQRTAAVTAHPKSLRHTFTLGDFAALAASALAHGVEPAPADLPAADQLGHLVRQAVLRRPFVVPLSASEAALVDPWQRPDSVVADMVRRADAWLEPVVDLLNLAPSTIGP